jgi:futalosine hydrolase
MIYKVLIVSATQTEIAPLLEQYEAKQNIHSNKVFSFAHKRCAVDVLITGVGLIATAFEMGQWLARRHYDLVLNAGLAGSFNLDAPIGSVVQITNDEIAEWGAESPNEFIAMSQLPFFNANEFPYQNGQLIQNNIPQLSTSIILRLVKGITVNKSSGNTKTIKYLKKNYNPDAETMEGAAFMYVVLALGQSNFAAIRAISNYVEPRNTDNWNLPLAIKNLNQVLTDIIASHAKGFA